MNVELIKIGNSQEIRIPKPILEQCGFERIVSMEVRGHTLILKPASKSRQGWNESFKRMHKKKDDELLDPDIIESSFDQTKWIW